MTHGAPCGGCPPRGSPGSCPGGGGGAGHAQFRAAGVPPGRRPDARRRGAALGYSLLPTRAGARAEQAWATARYLGALGSYRLSSIIEGVNKRDGQRYIWTNAHAMVWALLRAALAPMCDSFEFRTQDIDILTPRATRRVVRDLTRMAARRYRVVCAYGQYVYKDANGSVKLSFTYRPGPDICRHTPLVVVDAARCTTSTRRAGPARRGPRVAAPVRPHARAVAVRR